MRRSSGTALDTSLLPGDAERVIVVHLDCRDVGIPHVRFAIEDCAQALGAVPPRRCHGRHRGIRGSCLGVSEAVQAIQLRQLRRLKETCDGLERNQAILRDALSDLPGMELAPPGPGDSKLGVRIVTPTAEHRERFLRLPEERSTQTSALDRYVLFDHPALRNRKSLYSGGFPWNPAEGDSCAISRDVFARARALLAPTFTIPVAPEYASEVQIRFSDLVRLVLSGEKSCVPVSCSSMAGPAPSPITS
ncbi:hypothetical protein [Streptomyces sp. YS-3]|uniref:hypothetical protein n=1 Tax=Streptomyces sp. YS-3 TaxID=3381352 RepID=UPI003862ADD6